MRKNLVKLAALSATAMSAVMAVPAYAAAEGAESDGAIVVTARRFEENAQDVPISMTVFSQE